MDENLLKTQQWLSTFELKNMRACWLFAATFLTGCWHIINLASAFELRESHSRVIGGQDVTPGVVSHLGYYTKNTSCVILNMTKN